MTSRHFQSFRNTSTRRGTTIGAAFVLVLTLVASSVSPVGATSDCSFTQVGDVMNLDGDCTTDSTIYVADGDTLNGNGYAITGVDPTGGHFVGAVVANAGSEAHVKNVTITVDGLTNACDAGANRLRGIMFEGASGSITHTNVIGINQGASGCQEGNAIEVRNAPFDGTHPNTQSVTISHNTVDDYQKTGIVVNGDVTASITNNFVGSADLPYNIAANSIQVGFGASGAVNRNEIVGNQWDVNSSWVATAVLIYAAGDVNLNHNSISGEGTDIGVYARDSGTVNVMNNKIARTIGGDDAIDAYGVGVYFYANSGESKVVRNKVSGWNYDFIGEDLQKATVFLP